MRFLLLAVAVLLVASTGENLQRETAGNLGDRGTQRALASQGSEGERYAEPAPASKFSGVAVFYVGPTGRGLRVQFEPRNESPAGVFVTGWCSVLRTFSRGSTCPG